MEKDEVQMDINEITTVQRDGNTLNCAKLPKVQYFKVQVQGVTGKKGERHATGYLVLVKCENQSELVNAPDIAARFGMKLRHNSFRTREAAIAGGKEYAEKWGKATSKTGRKTEEAKEKAVAEAKAAVIEEMKSALAAMGLTGAAIDALLANVK